MNIITLFPFNLSTKIAKNAILNSITVVHIVNGVYRWLWYFRFAFYFSINAEFWVDHICQNVNDNNVKEKYAKMNIHDSMANFSKFSFSLYSFWFVLRNICSILFLWHSKILFPVQVLDMWSIQIYTVCVLYVKNMLIKKECCVLVFLELFIKKKILARILFGIFFILRIH